MEKFFGKWKLVSSEKFDEYMEAVGVSFATRTIGNMQKPTIVIGAAPDGKYSIKTLSTFKNTEIIFKLGEVFDETTPDGRQVKTTVILEGEKLIMKQEGPVSSTFIRELPDADTMHVTLLAKNVVCKRGYKRDH